MLFTIFLKWFLQLIYDDSDGRFMVNEQITFKHDTSTNYHRNNRRYHVNIRYSVILYFAGLMPRCLFWGTGLQWANGINPTIKITMKQISSFTKHESEHKSKIGIKPRMLFILSKVQTNVLRNIQDSINMWFVDSLCFLYQLNNYIVRSYGYVIVVSNIAAWRTNKA